MPARNTTAICALIAITELLSAPLTPAAASAPAPQAAALAPPAVRASDAPQHQPQLLTWLKSANYSALDEYLTTLQSQYESGAATEEQLYTGFRQLYEDTPANERYFDAWVQAYPRSYAAHLSRGVYHYRMASFIRGEDYLSNTSDSQINSMITYLDQAHPELLDSMKLTAKPYLSTLYLLDVSRMHGSRGENRHWYEEGVRIDPTNTRVRFRYMDTLRPRWGGSYSDMQAFLEETRKQDPDPKLLARLEILIHSDKAEDEMQADQDSATQGNSQAVFDEWKKVVDLSEIAGEQPSNEALAAYMRVAADLHMNADVDRGRALLAKRNIDDGWSLERIAWALIQQHRDAEALPALQKAAELNQPWSQFVLGKTIYEGCPELNIKKDERAGLVWIERSAHLCHPDAVEFLTSHDLPGGCDSLAGSLSPALRNLATWWSGRGVAIIGFPAIAILLLILLRLRRRPTELH